MISYNLADNKFKLQNNKAYVFSISLDNCNKKPTIFCEILNGKIDAEHLSRKLLAWYDDYSQNYDIPGDFEENIEHLADELVQNGYVYFLNLCFELTEAKVS